MTILILANNDIGLYKFRKAFLEELISRENKVYISLPYGHLVPELEKLGCKFIDTALERRSMNPIRDISLYRQYCRILKEIKPDQVISYTIKPNIYGGFACRVAKIPFVANITGLGSAIESGGILQKLVFTMYKAGLAKAKVIFFENEGNREVLVNAGVVEKNKTHVLNGAGVDTNEYSFISYPLENPIRFLFVGRIMKEKGVDELFEAMIRLKSEYGEDVALDVLGMFEESYQQKIERLQNDGIIMFHGYQQDVKSFYEKAHCVVLPSYHEGMSNVLLEAASSGRPIITSNIHGCKEAVIEGESGLLCEVQNADSLYECMKLFCKLPREKHEQMGKIGRKHMIECFDKKDIVKRTLERLEL